MTQQFAPNYGSSIICGADIDPTLRSVSGPIMMAYACVRRLSCRKGSLLSDPLYGIDLRDFLGAKTSLSDTEQTKIRALVRSELNNDERIASVIVESSFNTSSRTLTLSIKGEGALGPFSLTIGADQLTVQLLDPL